MTYQLRCSTCGTQIGYGAFTDGPNGDVVHSVSISGARVARSQLTLPEPQLASQPPAEAPPPLTQTDSASPVQSDVTVTSSPPISPSGAGNQPIYDVPPEGAS